MTPILAIDPGAGGGLALRAADGTVSAAAMPDGMTAQIDAIRTLAAENPGLQAVVEKVGWWMPGDHPNSACKFARHCGHIEAALYALAVGQRAVSPQTWMKTLGSLPKDKAARKRQIRDAMQARFPALSVTLATADALAILTYAESAATPLRSA